MNPRTGAFCDIAVCSPDIVASSLETVPSRAENLYRMLCRIKKVPVIRIVNNARSVDKTPRMTWASVNGSRSTQVIDSRSICIYTNGSDISAKVPFKYARVRGSERLSKSDKLTT